MAAPNSQQHQQAIAATASSSSPFSSSFSAAAASSSASAAATTAANPLAGAQTPKVTKRKKRSLADFKAGKQADELKRQKKLANYRGFVNDTMGVKDMETETDPEASQDGVAGVVERALIDCGINDEVVLNYIDDQVKEFLEQTFKKNFDELK